MPHEPPPERESEPVIPQPKKQKDSTEEIKPKQPEKVVPKKTEHDDDDEKPIRI